ncbi:MAG: PIN domain-containing protein [Propionibacteriaceae bacterium]|nr:PIN domain-containing protein [Propionibacteriaceae bacterium]
MSLAYLLDTSLMVEVLRGRAGQLVGRLTTEAGRLGVSTVTVMELEYGAERSRSATTRQALEQLLTLVTVCDFDRAAAREAARVRAYLTGQGTPIGPFDTLIAGHALATGTVVVTHNVREFVRVPGLRVEDWL